jgi:Fe-S cluster assembly protein SufD
MPQPMSLSSISREYELLEGIKFQGFDLSQLDIDLKIKRFRKTAWEKFLSLPIAENKSNKDKKKDEIKFETFTWQNISIRVIDSDFPQIQKDQGEFSGEIIIEDNDCRTYLNPKYSEQGVILCDLLTAEKKHAEILNTYLGKTDFSRENKLSILALAAATGGFFLYVPTGVQIETPILFNENCTQKASLVINRSMIILEEGASATVIRQTRSELTNIDSLFLELVQTYLESTSSLKLMELQSFGESILNFGFEQAKLEKDASMEWISSQIGSKTTQASLDMELAGEGSSASIAGLYIPNESQQFDIQTRQNHIASSTTSNLLYKGVLLDSSQTTWRGMINVSREAIKSQSYQANNNLILSDQAHIDSIPGMEILTNDVQCKHGATIGKIDQNQLFYLESRGVDQVEAKQLLVEGFLDPVIQKYPVERIRSKINQLIHEKLSNLQ